MSPSQTGERYDEDASSGTDVTEKELLQTQPTTSKDTDDDASFSENEQLPSKSRQSDLHQEDSLHMHDATKQARRSSVPAADESSASHESTSKPTESSINLAHESKQEQDRLQTNQKQVEAQLEPVTVAVTHTDIVPDQEVARDKDKTLAYDFVLLSAGANNGKFAVRRFSPWSKRSEQRAINIGASGRNTSKVNFIGASEPRFFHVMI